MDLLIFGAQSLEFTKDLVIGILEIHQFLVVSVSLHQIWSMILWHPLHIGKDDQTLDIIVTGVAYGTIFFLSLLKREISS